MKEKCSFNFRYSLNTHRDKSLRIINTKQHMQLVIRLLSLQNMKLFDPDQNFKAAPYVHRVTGRATC
jgi:hypothetical protein